ncbi:MAG: four-carbon acid sugar kinase family protein [Bacteroidota bacterium]
MTIDDAAKYFNAPEDVNLLTRTSELIFTSRETVVVLDDDPTGTQTVHDVPVLTDWKVESLQAELAEGKELVYVLTNSRSLPADEAQRINREIGEHLSMASKLTGRDVRVISRSDSTLRGHYPLEIEELQQALKLEKATQVIVPAFMEGGRYTLEDVHYVQEGKDLVPAAQTPYAEDKVFGYQSSHLVDWIEEKYLNRIVREQIKTLSISLIRDLYARQLAQWFIDLEAKVVVVNAASYYDLEKVALALRIAEQQGRDFIYRTAASFVKTYCAMQARPLLEQGDIKNGPHGGLIIVGSHIKKSSEQLKALLAFKEMKAIEVPVQDILADKADALHLTKQLREEMQSGRDVVIFTSREAVSGESERDTLELASKVSAFLVDIIQAIDIRPGYLIAKGGITSSDIATKALKVRRAVVKGQIYPGIPVWELGYESPFPGMRYIIFPGNVGEEDTLLQMVLKLNSGE